MDEIEVVIRLPKEIYEKIQQIDRIISGRRNGKTIEFALWNGVKNGTVLPKNHGKLIDADALIDTLGCSDKDIYCKDTIKEDAPIIIEAEGGRE